MSRIGSFPSRTYSRYRKIVYRHSTNSPYISGDTFAQLCDVVIKDQGPRDLNMIKNARSIFCESHRLEEFIEDFRNIINAKIIFAGNSDYEFHNLNFNLPPSVKKMYLQNSFISDSKRIFTLPIGLENISLGGRNGSGVFSVIPYSFSYNRILVGPFGPTHSIRNQIQNEFKLFSKQNNVDFLAERVSRRKYRDVLRNYNYVSCPRGNGVDTHRLWESLYYGRFPIVQKNEWALSLAYLKLPITYINNWSIDELDFLRNLSPNIFDPNKIEGIWESYWHKTIKNV